MIPLHLRDALYAGFRKALEAQSPAADFRATVLGLRVRDETERAYVRERAARFMKVLRLCPAQGREDDPFARVLRIGQLLFNHGLFFDCHEFLEIAWRQAGEPERTALQGLIQAGAGFHKLEFGSIRGAAELLAKGAEKLESVADRLSWRVGPFARELRRVGTILEQGGKAPVVPRMEL